VPVWAAPDSVLCARPHSGQSGRSQEKCQAPWLKITGLSGEPGGQRLSPASTVDAQSAVDTWRPHHLSQRSAVAPDCPVRHQIVRCTIWQTAANGRLDRLRKGIAHCWMSGVHRTVRCTHEQKATRAFQTKEQRLPWHLGL
jgi:hypothetical protein